MSGLLNSQAPLQQYQSAGHIIDLASLIRQRVTKHLVPTQAVLFAVLSLSLHKKA